nr:MAG TPA: hypothetical protein [Caudoviricetes sp.]
MNTFPVKTIRRSHLVGAPPTVVLAINPPKRQSPIWVKMALVEPSSLKRLKSHSSVPPCQFLVQKYL